MTENAVETPRAKEKAVSFSKPEQIAEILAEANRLKLQVLVKYANDGKSVRGFVESFDAVDMTIRIGGISVAGDALLKNFQQLRVEFILLSRKLVFVSVVKARVQGKLLLACPVKLVAIERRQNSRFKVPASNAAFVEFHDRKIDLNRMDAPFFPNFMRDDKNYLMRLRIDDVSLGGVACFTRFGAISEVLKPDEIGLTALLVFPKTAPISVPVSIRWVKKTLSTVQAGQFDVVQRSFASRILKAPTVTSESLLLKETYYRLGLQFSEVSKELDLALRTCIRVVQTAESV